MQRALLAATTSTLLLAGAIVLWPELFLFAKTFYPPSLAQALPSVLLAAPLLAVVSLSLVAVASPHPLSVARWLLAPVLLAPLAGVVVYVSTSSARGAEVWANAIFNYFWVLGFHLLAPAIAVFFSSLLVHWVKRHWPARKGDA